MGKRAGPLPHDQIVGHCHTEKRSCEQAGRTIASRSMWVSGQGHYRTTGIVGHCHTHCLSLGDLLFSERNAKNIQKSEMNCKSHSKSSIDLEIKIKRQNQKRKDNTEKSDAKRKTADPKKIQICRSRAKNRKANKKKEKNKTEK